MHHVIKAYYQLRVLDKNGKVIRRRRRRLSRSFVLAFIQHLWSASKTASPSVADTGNTARTLQNPGGGPGEFLDVLAAATQDDHGIVVGTGTTAGAMTDYALETQIAEGVGAGQLSHQSSTVGDILGSGVERHYILSRTFTNGSGSQITVTEIGVYCDTEENGGTDRFFCIIRDILASSEAIADGQSLAVDYTIKIEV